jgi:hypothetical protein
MSKPIALVIAAVATAAVAHADPPEFYLPRGAPGGGILLVSLGAQPALAKLVRAGGGVGAGPVQCFEQTDGYSGRFGAGDGDLVGCFVSVTHDGRLVAPVRGKPHWTWMNHLMNTDFAGTVTVEPMPKAKDALVVTIDGEAAAALEFWTDCQHDLVCELDQGMGGKIGGPVAFGVAKGGALKAWDWAG